MTPEHIPDIDHPVESRDRQFSIHRWKRPIIIIEVMLLATIIMKIAFSNTGSTSSSYTLPRPVLALSTNIPQGTFILNGHHIAVSTVVAVDATPSPVFSPVNGANTVVLSADPFLPQTCVFLWPERKIRSGSCLFSQSTSGNPEMIIYSLLVPETLQNLPPALQKQALNMIQSAPIGPNLSWDMTAQSGSHIPEGAGSILINHPWQIDMHRSVDASTLTYPEDGPNFSYFNYPSSGPIWIMGIFINDIWNFTSIDDKQTYTKEVRTDSFALVMSYSSRAILQAYLIPPLGGPGGHSLWDRLYGPGWVKIYGPSYACDEVTALAGNMLLKHYWPIVAASGVHGCLFSIAPIGTATAPAAEPQFLVRFGELLAVNAQAQQIDPNLPLATSEEIQDALSNDACTIDPAGCTP